MDPPDLVLLGYTEDSEQNERHDEGGEDPRQQPVRNVSSHKPPVRGQSFTLEQDNSGRRQGVSTRAVRIARPSRRSVPNILCVQINHL